MGSINRSHTEPDGGILLFNGELILLYCDSVSCEIGGKESFKGRVYLTTHRLVIIMTPFRQNAPVKSFCAPFCAITKCGVEQPIFGANYIEATVRDETDPSKSFSFKLKFSKGGAIELAMAMNRAVQVVGRNYNPSMPPPPAYTPSPSAQYYQAPPTVYAPGYNSGLQVPTQQFPDQPPIGFIYTSDAPPPYPGVGGAGANQNPEAGAQQNYPGPQQGGGASGYPQATGGYPGQQQQQQPPQQQGGYPYPAQQQYGGGYPGQQQSGPAFNPQQQPPPSHQYPPGQQQFGVAGGYPGYNQQPAQGPATMPAQSSSGYPSLNDNAANPQQHQQQQAGQQQQSQQSSGQAWPSAPSFNPNWQDDKKNV